MSLDDLYREVILDHYSHPRNRGVVPPPAVVQEGANPLCGDEIRVSVRVRDGSVDDVKFEAKGCSISQASASMMTELVKGRPVAEAARLIGAFKAMMHGEAIPGEGGELGDLESLQGVRKFPVRVKCATLAWVTLEMALGEAASRQAGSGDASGPAASVGAEREPHEPHERGAHHGPA